jgi:chromate reductase
MPYQILSFSGSQRVQSWSSALLRAFQAQAPADVDFDIYEEHKQLPLFDPDLDIDADTPPSVRRLRQAVSQAQAIVIVSPEYAHGVSGTIKNTLDWLVSHPDFADKPVAVINPSYQSFHADAALKETLRTMSAVLIPGACLRIPVIGSALSQHAIEHSPEFALLIDEALHAIIAQLRPARSARGPAA